MNSVTWVIRKLPETTKMHKISRVLQKSYAILKGRITEIFDMSGFKPFEKSNKTENFSVYKHSKK